MALTFRCMELLSHLEERVFQTPLVYKELPLHPLTSTPVTLLDLWINRYGSFSLVTQLLLKVQIHGQEQPIPNIFVLLLVTQHFRHSCFLSLS